MNFICPYTRNNQYELISNWYEELKNNILNKYPNKDNHTILFKDVLKKGNINNLRNIYKEIFKDYEDTEDCINSHIKIFLKLLNYKENIDLIKDKDKLLLYIIINKTEDNYIYGDVSGYKYEDNTSYAIEFTPWIEWLNYYILQENIDSIGIDTFIAWAIYEMTFMGFEEDEIQGELNYINNLMDDAIINNSNEQRNKLKLVE